MDSYKRSAALSQFVIHRGLFCCLLLLFHLSISWLPPSGVGDDDDGSGDNDDDYDDGDDGADGGNGGNYDNYDKSLTAMPQCTPTSLSSHWFLTRTSHLKLP